MFPIILLILPSLNSLVGNISTVLISRLTAHLYIGTIQPKIERSDRLTEDFYGLLYSTILSLAFLLFIGYFIALFTGVKIVNPLFIILIVSFTVIVLFIAMFIFLLISAIYLFKWGKDPNNFLIPFVTSLNDFLTPLLLIVFIIIFI
ncbi:MAG: magnesium transporter [Promethearchaeota archaeon]